MMRLRDTVSLAAGALTTNLRRTVLIALATAIGVTSVLMLTAFGEGARRFVTGQFESLGTNLLVVLPGRSETVGGPPPVMGETPRDLTVDDAFALVNHPTIKAIAPVMVGNAPVSTADGLEREVTILGSTADMAQVRRLDIGQGRFLPAMDPARGAPVCVLGYKIRRELFGSNSAYGQWVRIGDRRFRVIGVLADSGVSVGVDFDDLVIIPVGFAQVLFNRASLFRVLAEARSADDLETAVTAIHTIIAARHEGEDDVTVISQDSVVETLARILATLTYGVAGISAISLTVVGILIMNVILVSVTQRRAEIGLMKAIGAETADVRRLFLFEAVMLAGLGALAGLVLGLSGAEIVAYFYPKFPVHTPLWAIAPSLIVAVGAGLVFGVLPARRGARLDPVEALSKR